MCDLAEKVRRAIEHLKSFEPRDGKGYYLCYSGGKDSDCIRILADFAGVKHDIVHNLTTIDASETIYYVQSIHCTNVVTVVLAVLAVQCKALKV